MAHALPEEVDPLVWRRFALEDLAAARATIEVVVFPRQSSYHSQQAGEKAIKAVLLQQGISPPFIHDIGALVARLPAGVQPPVSHADMADLTSWAVAQRYPGAVGTIARDDAERSLRTADVLVRWMTRLVPDPETAT